LRHKTNTGKERRRGAGHGSPGHGLAQVWKKNQGRKRKIERKKEERRKEGKKKKEKKKKEKERRRRKGMDDRHGAGGHGRQTMPKAKIERCNSS